jgi:4,5-DOPA dioxygenase extradiol
VTLPTLFVSHGAPSLVLHKTPAHDFLAGYGAELIARHGRPKAILLASAHFEADRPTLTADERPGMIYDFGGFEPELYDMVYPAPGAPDLARRAGALIAQAGEAPQLVTGRGFDHGTWAPLMLLFPKADIPVVQLSISPGKDAAWHAALGRALAPLREEGVLIVGSGTATHNLREIFAALRRGEGEAPAPEWVRAFNDWVRQKAEAGALDDMAHAFERAPYALKNHPTPDHFFPLPFAMGAAGEGARGVRVHASTEYGAMMMDAYAFG